MDLKKDMKVLTLCYEYCREELQNYEKNITKAEQPAIKHNFDELEVRKWKYRRDVLKYVLGESDSRPIFRQYMDLDKEVE